jgi:transposase
MNKKSGQSKAAADKLVKNIRRKTRQTYSAEEKIRIVLAGLRGEESISALCRREGIAESLYYSWSKEFLEAGKRRLSGDTARQATSPEVKELRSESLALKECVADLTLENRLLKKSKTGGGGYEERDTLHRRNWRLSASWKMGIYRQRKPWTCWASIEPPIIAGIIFILRVDWTRWRTNHHARSRSGTAFPSRFATTS